jgi:glycosyltransferase involved in cell wall biosynthesis
MSLEDLPIEAIAVPKVSIVIPAYNAMTYLPATLASVFQQTFSDFEVLLVNDGSTDSIQTWVAQTVHDPRVKLISQVNQGLSAARNTGITHSRSEYIAFLDADDLWHPTKLEQQVPWLDAHPDVGLIYNWTALIDSTGTPTGRVLGSEIQGNVLPEMLQRNIIDCPSVIVRRQCFDRVGLFDCVLRSVEDWDMWIRIAAVYPFAVTPLPLVYYRQHPSNMSKNWRVMEQSFQQVITKAFASVPPELQVLKPKSLGSAYLVLAWKALQSQDRDCQLASQFQKQAIAHNPDLHTSRENLRLTIAILTLKWLGTDGYNRFLSVVYTLRRRLSGITS